MTRFLPAALCAALALPAWPSEFVPGGDGGALARSFALPALGEYDIAPVGQPDTRLTLDFANEFVREGLCSNECVVLDGETARLRLTWRRGIARGWDMGFDLPVLSQGGGFLDGWIEQWHGWFGLPNGGREFAPRNQYQYTYARGGVAQLDVTDHGTCIGDVGIGVGRQLGAHGALRALAKLPTGNGEPLCGGNAGGALWLDVALPMSDGASGYVAAGVSYNAIGDVLPSMQNREVFFGGLGLLLPIVDDVRVHAQVQFHTRLYDGSDLTPFARPGVPLTLGLQFGRGVFELGIQEDPSVNASPDFVAYLSLRRGPPVRK